MIAAGKPAVVVATENFGTLARASLAARGLQEALGIVLKGNPEILEEAALERLAGRALDEAVRRLTSDSGTFDRLVS